MVVLRTRVGWGPVWARQIIGMVVVEEYGSRRAELMLRGSRGTIGVPLWLRRQWLSGRRHSLLIFLLVLRGLLMVFNLLFGSSWLLRDM